MNFFRHSTNAQDVFTYSCIEYTTTRSCTHWLFLADPTSNKRSNYRNHDQQTIANRMSSESIENNNKIKKLPGLRLCACAASRLEGSDAKPPAHSKDASVGVYV